MHSTTNNVRKILQVLESIYPDVKTQLIHKNPFELLIATILSAQCTDRQVNKVSGKLFKKLKTPADFANINIKELEKIIHSTGFYHNKAKNIKNCCIKLINDYNSKVPDNIGDLTELPGVGRKTANVVLGVAFNVDSMVVDTHVSRISQRLGLTNNKDSEKIEYDLMKIIPKNKWNNFSLQLIYFGREFCISRNPKCIKCPLTNLCNYKK